MSRILAAAVCVFALGATPSFAQSQYESRVVYFGDLNLDSRAGADTLIRRIEAASDVVCGDRTGPQTISERGSVRSCESYTTEEAINDVGHPNVLYRYYGYMPEVVIEESWDDEPYYEVKRKY